MAVEQASQDASTGTHAPNCCSVHHTQFRHVDYIASSSGENAVPEQHATLLVLLSM